MPSQGAGRPRSASESAGELHTSSGQLLQRSQQVCRQRTRSITIMSLAGQLDSLFHQNRSPTCMICVVGLLEVLDVGWA